MDKIYDICCGIDVHKKLIVACLSHKRKKELWSSVRLPGTEPTAKDA